MTNDPDSTWGIGADDEATVVSAGNEPSPTGPEPRRTIFISYKHGEENDLVARALHAGLCKDYEVFYDEGIFTGYDWADRIEEELKRADGVIALISADAVKDDDVIEEIKIAHALNEKTGRPRIMPVRLWFSEQYGYKLGRLIGPLQSSFLEDLEHIPDLIDKLRDAIEEREPPPDTAAAASLSRYLLSGLTAGYLSESFVARPELNRAEAAIAGGKLVWLTGDAGVRNFAARSLAAKLRGTRVYDIPKSQSWEAVGRTQVGGSAIIFRDVTAASHFDDDAAGKELAALSGLISSGNLVIVTSAPDDLLEAKQHMRRNKFRSYHSESLSHDSYQIDQKLDIFKQLLKVSLRFEAIDEHQYDLAKSLGEKPSDEGGQAATRGGQRGPDGAGNITTLNRSRFHQVLDRWTPEDVERFVINILPEARTEFDIAKLLQCRATLNEEIHSWFFSLNDSVKCFVLTLAIFPGLSNTRLWEKYGKVFDELQKLDSKLSLWPLGVCRERAAPHVTLDGSADFKSARVAEAVRLEIAKNYREYFLQLKLKGLLKDWSVPSEAQPVGTDPTPEVEAGPRELTRDKFSVARMVGEAAKVELSDIMRLIEQWADHDERPVREAVAEAFEVTATDVSAGFRVLKVLADWCFSPAGTGRGHRRVWAAASALGRMASVDPGSPVSARALTYLERLTEDRRSRVTDFVAEAAKRAARKVPPAAIARLLGLLAHNQKPYTRINTADALNEARLADDGDDEAAERLFEEWASSEDASLRWAVVCSLILQGNQRKWKDGSAEAVEALRDFIRLDGVIFADAIRETVSDKFYGKNALATLDELAQRSEYGAGSELVTALAGSFSQQPDEDFLNLLRASTLPRLITLVAEIRCELWKGLLDSPPDFLLAVDESIQQPDKFTEVSVALELLARPEPQGRRRQLISALAACFTAEHKRLERVLLKLKEADATADVPLAVRSKALGELLGSPTAFVAFVRHDVSYEERAPDTIHVLNLLASPEPIGRRGELIETMVHAYTQKPEEVNRLLQLFRSSGSVSLLQAAQAVQPELLENLLSSPLEFLAQVEKSIEDDAEWEETLNVLQYLAAPRPQGTRQVLAHTLAKARLHKPDEVGHLLQHISWASGGHLDLFFRLRVAFEYHWLKLWGAGGRD